MNVFNKKFTVHRVELISILTNGSIFCEGHLEIHRSESVHDNEVITAHFAKVSDPKTGIVTLIVPMSAVAEIYLVGTEDPEKIREKP